MSYKQSQKQYPPVLVISFTPIPYLSNAFQRSVSFFCDEFTPKRITTICPTTHSRCSQGINKLIIGMCFLPMHSLLHFHSVFRPSTLHSNSFVHASASAPRIARRSSIHSATLRNLPFHSRNAPFAPFIPSPPAISPPSPAAFIPLLRRVHPEIHKNMKSIDRS